MAEAVVYLLLGVAGTAAAYERVVRVLRTELNGARVNEQLLLTRLAARTPAEYHAIVDPPPAVEHDSSRYLFDDTGLVLVEDGED